nr:hypothetical protein [Mixta tenebrionis]
MRILKRRSDAIYLTEMGAFIARRISQWVAEDRLVFREHIVDDLTEAPEAFIGMLEGKNFGKLIIRVASDRPGEQQ